MPRNRILSEAARKVFAALDDCRSGAEFLHTRHAGRFNEQKESSPNVLSRGESLRSLTIGSCYGTLETMAEKQVNYTQKRNHGVKGQRST
jgi:hypothetical protein